jgi:hypothetical protein
MAGPLAVQTETGCQLGSCRCDAKRDKPMSVWANYNGVVVPPPQPGVVRPRFSLTSDILSFRRCSRQYGYFGNDGFVPAQATQIFYGTIIHQVLDRCHRHYWGFSGHPQGTVPTDADVDQYFNDVQNALKSHGVRPASPAVATKASRVLKIFNRVPLERGVVRVEHLADRLRGDFLLDRSVVITGVERFEVE